MRLIDADALRNEFCSECLPDKADDCRFDPLCGTMMWVNEAPTIDAVPVVRCKDCKYKFSANGHDKKGCPLDGVGLMTGDDFCSCGERRSDD